MSSAPVSNSTAAHSADAKYDLTFKIAPCLDVHLLLPMLSFLEQRDMYESKDIAISRLELVRKTNMMDYAIGLFQEVHGEDEAPPAEYEAKRQHVLDEYTRRLTAAMPILEFIDNGDNGPTEAGLELINNGDFKREFLMENCNITDEHIEALYMCAKFKFDCGEYDVAANYLYHYRLLVPIESHQSLRALWGKFASEILSEQWEEADRDRAKLCDMISKLGHGAFGSEFESGRAKSEHKLMVLQQRTWLLHWSLYVFFNAENGRNMLVDFFLQPDNLNAIQTNSPWLLRYLTTVIIINKRRRNEIKTLLNVISQEQFSYSDPIIEFVQQLLVNFNFEAAQEKLAECESVLRSDYFLSAFHDEDEFVQVFLESARLFIFETYCRIHQKIDIQMLGNKLGLSEGDAERWVVNMIRNAHFDARIDRASRQVVMSVNYPSVYQQVIAKTRDLSMRTRILADAVDSAIHDTGKRDGRQSSDRTQNTAQSGTRSFGMQSRRPKRT